MRRGMAELDSQFAFVTGAGSGLGREIALTFARAGARVAVNDLRPEPAAKGGIAAFTKAVAREVGPLGILVNAIAPGYIDTPLLDAFGSPEQQAMQKAVIAMQTPLGRLGEAREVAATALFLASPGASFFTGQVLAPNGGYVI